MSNVESDKIAESVTCIPIYALPVVLPPVFYGLYVACRASKFPMFYANGV